MALHKYTLFPERWTNFLKLKINWKMYVVAEIQAADLQFMKPMCWPPDHGDPQQVYFFAMQIINKKCGLKKILVDLFFFK